MLFDRLRVQEKGTELGRVLAEAHVFYNGTVMQELAEDTIDISDIPSMALPYPTTFVQAELPLADENDKMEYIAGQQAGILFKQYDFEPKRMRSLKLLNDNCRWTVEATLFLKMPGWTTIDNVCTCMLSLNDQGVIIPVGYTDTYGLWYIRRNPEFYNSLQQFITDSRSDITLDDYDEFMSVILEGGLYTIGLLHCRNIGTEEVTPRRAEAHKMEKQTGIPMTSYKVLKITGKSKSAGTVIGTVNPDRKLAMHTCRAHFMTFYEDAPLFGKHTGKFFVPSHIKGNASRGVVAKDYEVAVKKEDRIQS